MSELKPHRPLCPTCGDVMSSDARPAKAYRCGGCGSFWLPRSALVMAKVSLPQDPVPATRDVDRRPCPGCDRLMALRGDKHLHIDVCIWCGGVFLDPGELQQLKQSRAHRRPTDNQLVTQAPARSGDSDPWWVDALLELLCIGL